MSSAILTKMGLGALDIGYLFIGLFVLVLVLLVLTIILLVQNNKLKKKYNRFMQGAKAKSLEKEIQDLIEEVDNLSKASKSQKKEINDLYRKHRSTFQKMGLIKYDAFKEMGGKLSYGLALLDEDNNGFIINSVHSSAGCYSYSKHIKDGKSEIDLSEEEKIVIEEAIRQGN
ncbi:MAG: DUF4446 family protein [Lachnospiraceae bacterium]|nr:DUF4446 family protein [Lachnospiraceae bacterium]MBQ8261222.1 DUF4446 family protein [Lachnospiraceae bacterium]